jgi:4-amino-4-deoxy-L-arabinose transferase-like glycosyltransferase
VTSTTGHEASAASLPVRGPAVRAGSRVRLWVALILLGVAVLTFYRLGAGSLWDQDETKYAQVAREILQTGDWITLHDNGRPWYVHPPFYMWLVAATARLAGWSEFTVRFWSAVASLLTVYATILLGGALFCPRAGLLAGAILAVTFQFLVQSRLAVFDTVLLAWMLLAVYAFVRAYQGGRRADYLWFFLCAGLATLTKGPIGLLLPALVIVPFVTVRRAWHRWREVPWAAGVALYVVVGLSWYAVETWLHGWAFASPVFGYYGVGRFFGVVENQAGPWYYYVPVLLAGAFPWTAFWPSAAAYHVARARENDGSLMVLLWCGITWAFYSAAGTKLPNYVLPIYPFAAIGVAALGDAALTQAQRRVAPASTPARARGDASRPGAAVRAVRLSASFLLVLLAILCLGIDRYLSGLYPGQFRSLGHVLLVPAAALGGGVCLAVLLSVRRRPLGAFAALCAAMAVTWLAVLTWVVPVVEAQKPMKPLALEIRGALRPGDRIAGYRLDIDSSLIFYTDHHVDWVNDAAALRREMCAPGRVFLVIARGDEASVRGMLAQERLALLPQSRSALLPAGLRLFAERGGVDVLLKPATARCSPR